jgi:hypothetical protein
MLLALSETCFQVEYYCSVFHFDTGKKQALFYTDAQ